MPTDAIDFTRLAPAAGSRIAIVGGSGGIGRVLRDACVALDLKVANLDLPAALEDAPSPEGVVELALDATDAEQVAAAFGGLDTEWGGLDILVHLPGFTDTPAFLEALAPDRFDEMIRVSLHSTHLVGQVAVPLLRKAGGGSVVTIASGLAVLVEKGFGAYGAAKAGVIALTKALAKECADDGIRVNAVAPGAVDTAFLSGGLTRGGAQGKHGWFQDVMEKNINIMATIPMGRIAVPEDVVGPILFLAGDASRYMTGQVLFINGGRLMP